MASPPGLQNEPGAGKCAAVCRECSGPADLHGGDVAGSAI